MDLRILYKKYSPDMKDICININSFYMKGRQM